MTIAKRLAPKVRLQGRERLDDAVRGCVGIALRRASLFSRAPVVHDVTLAFTIWGFFDENPRGFVCDHLKGGRGNHLRH